MAAVLIVCLILHGTFHGILPEVGKKIYKICYITEQLKTWLYYIWLVLFTSRMSTV